MQKSYSTEHIQVQLNGNEPQTVEEKSAVPANNRAAIILSLITVYILWGATYLSMRIALQSFPPYLMAGIRFVIAGGILYLIMRVRGTANPSRKQWAAAVLIGGLLFVGGNGGVSFAEQWVASGLASLGIASVPLWAALFAGLWGRWPTRLELLGLGLGFTGVVLLNLDNGVSANPIGAIILFISPISWALGSIWSHHLPRPTSGGMASAIQMLAGGILLLILGTGLGERMHGFPTIGPIVGVLFLIIFGSLIAFSAYNYLLFKVRPSLATSYAYINPLVAVGLGIGFAGEHITPVGFLAMLVILTGVVLVSLVKDRTVVKKAQ